MKKIMLALVGLVMCVAMSGCATIFGHNERTVQIQTFPSNARVYYNGEVLGSSPTSAYVGNTYASNVIMVKKPGYQTEIRPIGTEFQPIAILDVLFFPGLVIDLITGNIQTVTTRNIAVHMTKLHHANG